MTAKEIAPIRELLEATGCRVIDFEQGFVTCPGKHRHTTPNAASDCKLFNNGNGFFQLYCHHKSCAERIEFTNKVLAPAAKQRRSTAGTANPVNVDKKLEQQRQQESLHLYESIQSEYAWDFENIMAESNDSIHAPFQEHYLHLLGMFSDQDRLWIGRDIYDTGSSKHASRFRLVKEWLAEPECPGAFTCPSAFKPGSFSRCADAVVEPKFLVVESDNLGKNDIGGIFRWLDKGVGLHLRAIVDTGGKSLHGWFDYPEKQSTLSKLKEWLPRLGCDPAMFNPAQPCRLPGAIRHTRDGDREQRLVYIR